MKEKKKKKRKKLQVAPPGFESAPQLPPAQKVCLLTTGPCDHCTIHALNINILRVFLSV